MAPPVTPTSSQPVTFMPQYAWKKFYVDLAVPTSFAEDGTATPSFTAGLNLGEFDGWIEPVKDVRVSLGISDFALKMNANPLGFVPTLPSTRLGVSYKIWQLRAGLDNTGNFTTGAGVSNFWRANDSLELGADLALGNVANPEWAGPTGISVAGGLKQPYKILGRDNAVELNVSYAQSGWGSPEVIVIPHYNLTEMIPDDPLSHVFSASGETALELTTGVYLKAKASYEVGMGGAYSDLETPRANVDGLTVVQESTQQYQKGSVTVTVAGANSALATLPASPDSGSEVSEVSVTKSKWEVAFTWRPDLFNTTAQDYVVNTNGNFGDTQYWDWYATDGAKSGFDTSVRFMLPTNAEAWQKGKLPMAVYLKFSHDDAVTHSYYLDTAQEHQPYEGHVGADSKPLPNGSAPTNKITMGWTYSF